MKLTRTIPALPVRLSPYLALPAGFAEVLFLLWLLVRGAKIPPPDEPIPAVS